MKALSCPDKSIITGSSKLGGLPDAPPGFQWPQFKGAYLAFVAQINLQEAQNRFENEQLPKSGLISLFYDDNVWGFDPKDKDGFRVYYFEGETSKLQRQTEPLQEEKKALFGIFKARKRQLVYKSCSLEMKAFLSLPGDPSAILFSEEEHESYFEMLEEIGNHHRLLGYSEPIQGEMEDECALVTNGLYCGDSSGYKDPRAEEFLKSAKDWRLLLQIDTESEASNMMWGDAGRLYFWIKEDDLAKHRFENCWLISQCY